MVVYPEQHCSGIKEGFYCNVVLSTMISCTWVSGDGNDCCGLDMAVKISNSMPMQAGMSICNERPFAMNSTRGHHNTLRRYSAVEVVFPLCGRLVCV